MSTNKSTVLKAVTKDSSGNTVIEAIVSNYHGRAISATLLAPDAGATPTPNPYNGTDDTQEVQLWGADNLDPTKWRQKAEKSTTVYPLIAKSVYQLFGKGLTYYTEKRTATGIEEDWSAIPEIDDFFALNDIETLMTERLMDYRFYNNIFCEYILNEERTEILNVYHKEAEFTRFGKIKDDVILNVVYDGNWTDPKKKVLIPFLDADKITAEEIKTTSEKKFVSHSCFASPGRTLYAVPPHVAIYRDNGWLDYTNSIPEIMNAINENVMDIRYHIRIPYAYWSSIHAGWDSLPRVEKDAIIDKKITEMNDFLSGSKNAGKAFISHFATDEITGKPLAGWEINEISSSDKKDKFLTSVQEGDTQLVRALNMDVSLAGIQPAGGKMGAGSGSDKRTAVTNAVSMSYAETRVITEPLRHVARINGWPTNVKFVFLYDVPTSLNEDKSGVKSVNN